MNYCHSLLVHLSLVAFLGRCQGEVKEVLSLRMAKPVNNSKAKAKLPLILVSGANANRIQPRLPQQDMRVTCQQKGAPAMHCMCKGCSVTGDNSQGEEHSGG